MKREFIGLNNVEVMIVLEGRLYIFFLDNDILNVLQLFF